MNNMTSIEREYELVCGCSKEKITEPVPIKVVEDVSCKCINCPANMQKITVKTVEKIIEPVPIIAADDTDAKLVVTQNMLYKVLTMRKSDIILLYLDNGVIPDITNMKKLIEIYENVYYTNYKKLLEKCLLVGGVCNQELMNYVVELNKTKVINIEIFGLLFKHGLKPTIEMMETACENGYAIIFSHCLDYGFKPTQNMLEIASNNNNLEICKLCLESQK